MPRNPLPSDQATLKRVAKLYADGLSVRQLGSRMGWSYGATLTRLHLASKSGLVRVRSRGARSTLNDV